MQTKRHSEKLADRRASYADGKVSDRISKRAEEIQAKTLGMTTGDARRLALREMIQGIK